MKKQTGIWIDNSKAIIVKLQNGEKEITEIESEVENRIYHKKEGDKGHFSGSTHVSNEKTFDERKKNQINSFLKKVINHIKDDDELFIFGPAEMKLHLKKAIETDKNISAVLKATETSGDMTINQKVKKVKEFYNS